MTGKERILAALAGEKPDRVPFVPNIWQWFYVNELQGTLPESIREAKNPVDVLRSMGADIFSKFDGEIGATVYRTCEHQVEYEGELPAGKRLWASFTSFEEGPVRKDRIETPHGPLTHTWEYRSESGAPFEVDHWWKDFDSEYEAIRYWMEDTDVHLNPESAARRPGPDWR